MRSPAKEPDELPPVTAPGMGAITVGTTASGSLIALRVSTVSGARATVFMNDDQAERVIVALVKTRRIARNRRTQ